ncbi:MAG: DUF4124 domain-containing protein [Proteobacteria bacterium]|nr:DUF4124 domain-containing protein [Pseudomonadota bacterium]
MQWMRRLPVSRRALPALVAWGLALCAPALAGDAIYRWVDRDGRVNYGSQPPPGVKAEMLERGGVTVVPAAPARPAEAADTTRRIERLESALEQEKRLRREAEERVADERDAQEQALRAREKARAECEARFREPCDDEGNPRSTGYIVVPPRTFHPPRPPRDGHWPRHDGDGYRAAERPPRQGPTEPALGGMPKPVLPINPDRSLQAPRQPERRLPARQADD